MILFKITELTDAILNSNAIKLIIMCTISMFFAQFIKFIVNLFKNKKADLTLLYASGGMPSSHTSVVITLVVSIGLYQLKTYGHIDEVFVVALVLALIVIHDALNVRLESGKHAKVLNKIIENEEDKNQFGLTRKLKERLGHVPMEIIAGIILGGLIALIGFLTLE